MNRIILSGRPTKDPEVKYSQGENAMAIARFTLAVDRKKSSSSETDFISCVAFGKTAEFIEKYVRKGAKIMLEGSLQTGSYNNKDGVKVYTSDVVVETIEFAEKKKDDPTDSAAE